MKIYCCACDNTKNRRIVTGAEVYPHRKELYNLVFYKCDTCGNKVGCHKGTKNPLGIIPTKELANARRKIHDILDPMWRGKREARKKRGIIYDHLSEKLGWSYHTAKIRSIVEARTVYRAILKYKRDLTGQ